MLETILNWVSVIALIAVYLMLFLSSWKPTTRDQCCKRRVVSIREWKGQR